MCCCSVCDRRYWIWRSGCLLNDRLLWSCLSSQVGLRRQIDSKTCEHFIIKSVVSRGWAPSNRIWDTTNLHSPKQWIWLRTGQGNAVTYRRRHVLAAHSEIHFFRYFGDLAIEFEFPFLFYPCQTFTKCSLLRFVHCSFCPNLLCSTSTTTQTCS